MSFVLLRCMNQQPEQRIDDFSLQANARDCLGSPGMVSLLILEIPHDSTNASLALHRRGRLRWPRSYKCQLTTHSAAMVEPIAHASDMRIISRRRRAMRVGLSAGLNRVTPSICITVG